MRLNQALIAVLRRIFLLLMTIALCNLLSQIHFATAPFCVIFPHSLHYSRKPLWGSALHSRPRCRGRRPRRHVVVLPIHRLDVGAIINRPRSNHTLHRIRRRPMVSPTTLTALLRHGRGWHSPKQGEPACSPLRRNGQTLVCRGRPMCLPLEYIRGVILWYIPYVGDGVLDVTWLIFLSTGWM